jgi:CBS-domain-containing membrane protein
VGRARDRDLRGVGVLVLAVAFVGRGAGAAAAVLAGLGTWALQRQGFVAMLVNVAANAVVSRLAAVAFSALTGRPDPGSQP